MQIKALQFKKEDKTEVAIYIYFYESVSDREWRIDDIRYREFKKRSWKSLEKSFSDTYDYRKLSMDERRKYEMQKYIEFVGEDKLKEAIMNAWEQIKPDVERIFSSTSRNG